MARRIAPNRRTLSASPAYLQRHGTPRTPEELAQHAGVLLMGRDGRQDVWTLQTPEGGQVRVRMQSRFESNFGELMRDAVIAGQGIAVHSYWHIAEDLRAGRLVEVMPDYPPPTSQISAVMPARQLQPPRVRAFVDFLLEHFGETPPWELPSAARGGE